MFRSLPRPLVAAGLLAGALPVLAQSPVPLRVVPTPIAQPVAVAPAEESVVVELRVVGVDGADGRAAVAKLFEAKTEPACCESPCCAKPAAAKTAFLDGAQLKALLETCQRDRTANVMQAPKVTVLDGRSANVTIADAAKFTTGLDVRLVNGNPVMVPKEETVNLGTTFRVSGTLSADRKHVKLGLKYHDKRLASPDVPLFPVTTFVSPVLEGGSQGAPVPFTQFIQHPTFREVTFETAATVPNGGTVAVHAGKQKVQVRSEYGPPVVSQIPYLNRLFKNVGIAEVERDVVVLATAKRLDAEPVAPIVVKVQPWVGARPVPTAYQTVYIARPGEQVVRASAPPPAAEPTDLLAAYHAACAKGDKDAAMRLAVQALAQDPTCFGRK